MSDNKKNNESRSEHKNFINAMTVANDDKTSKATNIDAMTIIKSEKTSKQECIDPLIYLKKDNIDPLIFLTNGNQSGKNMIEPIKIIEDRSHSSDNSENDEVQGSVNTGLNTRADPPPYNTEWVNYPPRVQSNDLISVCNVIDPISESTIPTIQKLRHPNHNVRNNSGESENNKNSLTPLDAAERVISQEIFIHRYGEIRYFNGNYYEKVDNNKVAELLFRLGYSFVKQKGKYNYLHDMEQFFMRHPEILKANNEESEENYLAFKNCVLDLETNKTHKNNGDFIVTSCIDCEYFDFQVIQNTPNWNKYLSSVTGGDKELENLIMEVLGYYITSDMSAQRFVILWGPGGTGKSVFGNFLRSLFNIEAISSIPLQKLGDKFSLSSIVGKKLNVSMDLPGGKINDESIAVLKQLTGNDLCVFEAKYKDPVSFVNTCKFIFSTNIMVTPETYDSGFRRRIIIIPFIYQVPDELKDPHLIDKLLEEKQLIVFNALQHYRGLKSRNYKFTNIDYEFYINSVNNMTGISAVRYDMNDVVLEFIEQCCIFDNESKIHIRDLYLAYKNYCSLNCKESFETQSEFTTALKKAINNLGGVENDIEFKRIRNKNGNLSGVVGIALKQM